MKHLTAMVLFSLFATASVAKQLTLANGLKMTVFNQSKKKHKVRMPEVLADEQVLKMVVFNRQGNRSQYNTSLSRRLDMNVSKQGNTGSIVTNSYIKGKKKPENLIKLNTLNRPRSDEVSSHLRKKIEMRGRDNISQLKVKAMPRPADKIDASPINLRLKLSTGYRRDDLNFTIAAPSGSPNVLSELDWHDLHSQQIGADFDLAFAGGLYIQASADIGWIWHGRNRDSDWAGDNRTLEFSRSVADTEGYLFDLSAGLGYIFDLSLNNRLTPLVGYTLNEQHLNDKNGNLILSDRDNWAQYLEVDPATISVAPTGPFNGLDSDYDARWHGPWLGLRWDYAGTNLELFAQGEFHWLDYRAEADWNLRSDFQHPVSFVHKADAGGWVVKVGGSYRITDSLSLSLDANYRNWQTDSGDDDTFFAGGSKVKTKLNNAKWLSYGANLGLSWRF